MVPEAERVPSGVGDPPVGPAGPRGPARWGGVESWDGAGEERGVGSLSERRPSVPTPFPPVLSFRLSRVRLIIASSPRGLPASLPISLRRTAMNARRFAVILALVIVPAGRSAPAAKSKAEDDVPYKSAKVGDIATYKIATKVAGSSVAGVMTQTISAKSDKEMTVKTAAKMTANGMDIPVPEQESTIDLTKPFDPIKSGILGQG